jgi:hypothetical protein
MGVHVGARTTTEEFVQALEHALATPGPHLIEAMVPPSLSGLKLKNAAQDPGLAARPAPARGALPQAQDRALKLAGAATAGCWTCGAPHG